MSALLYRIGAACFRHKWRVLGVWAAILALFGLLALGVGGEFDDTFTIPGSNSQRALEQLSVTFPGAADAMATIVVEAPAGTRIDDEPARQAMQEYVDFLETDLEFVNAAQLPYNDFIKGLISEDGSYAMVQVQVQGMVSTFTQDQRAELTEAASTITELLPGSSVMVGGDVFSVEMPEITVVEALGVVVALIVLTVLLGIIAAFMPILSAITGVGIAVFLVLIGASVITVSSTALILVVMLCLAVGIDYSLFIISRHRDQLIKGLDTEESAARAVATSGSAVVFAGLTVIIALVGLSIAGVPFLSVMGMFTAVGVAIEVCLALTMLPALLGLLGDRLRPSERKARRLENQRSGRASRWWVRTVTKWPLVTVLIVVVGLGAVALPARNIELALPNSGRSAPGAQDRVTFDLITEQFGIGFNGPLVITGTIVESNDPMGLLDDMRAEIEQIDGVHMVAAAVPNQNADTGMIQVIPSSGPDDPATAELVKALRAQHDHWLAEYGVDTAVTGLVAVQIDVSDKLGAALLPFGIFVVGLSLILLTTAFRSLLVPIKAAFGYLLSVLAAFGVVTLVFNEGVGAWLINLSEPEPIISFLPIILMGILFGLAMDYEVFLTSRMREEYAHGNDNWIEDGFVGSSKVVIGAALIMVSVFIFFVPTGIGPIKPIALSLALGVAFDAFLVRMTLGPALMKLGGAKVWWLPTWLDKRLPVIDVEGEALTHQTELAAWPTPGDRSAIYAEGLSAVAEGVTLFDHVDLSVLPGEVLLVEGSRAARFALMYGLGGRVKFTEGEAKVLGRILPEEASLVRTHTPLLQPATPDPATELRRGSGGIVFVPSLSELPSETIELLNQAMVAPVPAGEQATSWLLGIPLGADPTSYLTVDARVLRLSSGSDRFTHTEQTTAAGNRPSRAAYERSEEDGSSDQTLASEMTSVVGGVGQ